jgi:hypothetical protein
MSGRDAFARGALSVEVAQSFCHRADFAIADLAVIDPDYAS